MCIYGLILINDAWQSSFHKQGEARCVIIAEQSMITPAFPSDIDQSNQITIEAKRSHDHSILLSFVVWPSKMDVRDLML